MTVELRAGDAALTVDPEDGGRWTSWRVGDLELLSGADVPVPPEFHTGCFTMAPYAGRVGQGHIEIGGAAHQLPIGAPPHAIHGFVAGRAWAVVEQAPDRLALETDLGPAWPVPARVEQVLRLHPDRLESALLLHADAPMPATIGWHPWFARRLARGGAAEWELDGGRRYVRGADGLPTGDLVDRRPGPWDDAFTGFASPPALRWPGALRLSVESSAEHFVLFDELPDVLCLEPQTGPPDAARLGQATLLDRGESLTLRCTWRWA